MPPSGAPSSRQRGIGKKISKMTDQLNRRGERTRRRYAQPDSPEWRVARLLVGVNINHAFGEVLRIQFVPLVA